MNLVQVLFFLAVFALIAFFIFRSKFRRSLYDIAQLSGRFIFIEGQEKSRRKVGSLMLELTNHQEDIHEVVIKNIDIKGDKISVKDFDTLHFFLTSNTQHKNTLVSIGITWHSQSTDTEQLACSVVVSGYILFHDNTRKRFTQVLRITSAENTDMTDSRTWGGSVV